MRILELFEGKGYRNLDEFVNQVGDEGKREITFDLAEDLIHFMNNDDEAYRRHLHPVVAKCYDRMKENKKTKPEFFAKAIEECYDMYLKEYPIRELPRSLDKKQTKETCEKIHEEICKHITDGKYD